MGPEVGSGGEGIIYAIARRPEVLAKVYRRAPSPRDVDKLTALVRSGTPELLGVTAWPLECLKAPSGAVVGFLMSRIADARGIHELYSPRGRVRFFPSADFRFLVHVAANVARLIASVHKAGFIIGDLNHGNILVRTDGTRRVYTATHLSEHSDQLDRLRRIINPPLLVATSVAASRFRGSTLPGVGRLSGS